MFLYKSFALPAEHTQTLNLKSMFDLCEREEQSLPGDKVAVGANAHLSTGYLKTKSPLVS